MKPPASQNIANGNIHLWIHIIIVMLGADVSDKFLNHIIGKFVSTKNKTSLPPNSSVENLVAIDHATKDMDFQFQRNSRESVLITFKQMNDSRLLTLPHSWQKQFHKPRALKVAQSKSKEWDETHQNMRSHQSSHTSLPYDKATKFTRMGDSSRNLSVSMRSVKKKSISFQFASASLQKWMLFCKVTKFIRFLCTLS